MASLDRLTPDETIISEIFPTVSDFRSTNSCIILNTLDKCILKFQFESSPPPKYPKDLLIRLELFNGGSDAVMALQRLANSQLPDVVPAVFNVGSAKMADGRLVEYSVTEYCTGTISLQDVWDTLDEANKSEIVDSVVRKMEKLQKLELDIIHRELDKTPFIRYDDASRTPQISIGGPKVGYFQNIKEFLKGLQQESMQSPSTCKLKETGNGITLESVYADIGRVELSHTDLDSLRGHAVFCHNDMEPRNILVTKVTSSEKDGTRYRLAAIIDWELGGLYPFAYEYAYKDNVLGYSNLSFSWYTLLKERTANLLPLDECHTKLIRAVGIIEDSKKRQMTRTVGIQFREKWIDRERLQKSPDARKGWVRNPCTDADALGNFIESDNDKLLRGILEKLGLE